MPPSNLDLSVMPVALLYPDPSLRLGTEYMTNSRWSFGISAGLGQLSINRLFFRNEGRSNYHLWEIRPEIKFYWMQRNYMGWYIAAEGVYVNTNSTRTNGAHHLSNENRINFDRAFFKKDKTGGVGKIGVKFLVGERFTIDLFTGIGLAYTRIKYDDYLNTRTESHDPFFEYEDYYPGEKWTGLISPGIKVGIRLWQKDIE